jgi:hypothetical protein
MVTTSVARRGSIGLPQIMFSRSLKRVSEPATKQDLEQATTQLRGEMGVMGEQLRGEMRDMKEELRGEMGVMGGQLRADMQAMEGRLRGDMGAMEARLGRQIGEALSHVANVMLEHVGHLVSPTDEKYKDLPDRHVKLRSDFTAHVADVRLHTRPPAAPAKRVRRRRSR